MSRHIYGAIVLSTISILFFWMGAPEIVAMGIFTSMMALTAWYLVFDDLDKRRKEKIKQRNIYIKKLANNRCFLLVVNKAGILNEIEITSELYNKLLEYEF